MARHVKQLTWIAFHINHINICVIFLVMAVGYYPFIQTIVRSDNKGTEVRSLEPACQSKCVVGVPSSSVNEFDSKNLNTTEALFVHFFGYNISPDPTDTTDILDTLNLVWVESNEAPFLSLDLGFNVYSFSTLSRIIYHMNVTVEVNPTNCLWNMSHSCITANLARAFLANVTKEKGVLCYAVNDSNTVSYRCCKGNSETQRVECDIPAVLRPEMATIFTTILIAAAIALLCFPAFFKFVPNQRNSDTLRSNIRVYNPLKHPIICTVQALRHYSTKYYFVYVIKKLLIGLALPAVYYIDYGLQWYTQTYDIPKMFNDDVKEVWVISKDTSIFSFVHIILVYNVVMVLVSLLPRPVNSANVVFMPFASNLKAKVQSLLERDENVKVNWLEPCVWTKDFFCFLVSCFGKGRSSDGSFCSKFVAFLGGFLLLLLSPVVTLLLFISYAGYVSPSGKMMRPLIDHAYLYLLWIFSCLTTYSILCSDVVVLFVLVVAAVASITFVIAFGLIFVNSLLLLARMVVYLWMGLVASKDYYFDYIALFSVFVYHSWDCLSSVTSAYQVLLKQTFEKCKELQEKQRKGRKALTFDDKGVPNISSELFKQIIDEILPRGEVYTSMILNIIFIILFLILTFASILVYGSSNLDLSAKAIIFLLVGLLPKMIDMFSEGSAYRALCEKEDACRVEKIVKDFMSQSEDANSDDGTSSSRDEEQQPSNSSGDQPPTKNSERCQPTLEERSMTEPAYSKEVSLSEGNGRGMEHVLEVVAEVHPMVPSINSFYSDDPTTTEEKDTSGIV